jgi:hypothetical protein
MLRRWHRQLLRRRIAVFAGRISDRALDHSLRVYEYVLAMYLLGLVCVVAFVSAELLGAGGYGYGFIAVGFAQAAVLGTLGMRGARIAGLDVARQLGLPDSMWWRVKAKTPQQYDRWRDSVTHRH